jgi:hypothetical protein
MPALTRRRSKNHDPRETWHIFFDDVHVGTIGEPAGRMPVGSMIRCAYGIRFR